MSKKSTVITATLGAVVLAAAGYLVYDKFFRGNESKQEESRGTGSTTLPDYETPKPEDMFAQYQASKYFPSSISIPKGKPKNIATLVDQCTDGAAFYHGSTGGTPDNFPRGLVREVCHHSIVDELDYSGCSAKRNGALYCNGLPVHKKDLFVLRYR